MNRNSRPTKNESVRGLIEWLGDSAAEVAWQQTPHPIPHDAKGIDHPLWPLVSFVARDYVPGLFNELNPLSLLSGNSTQTSDRDHSYLLKSHLEIIAGVFRLTDMLRLPMEKSFTGPEPDMRLCEIVFNFVNRPIFAPLIMTANKAHTHQKLWFPFVASSRLDGFLENVIALHIGIEAKADIPRLSRARFCGSDPDSASFWLRQELATSPPSTIEEMDKMCSDWKKHIDAEKKNSVRRQKGTKEQSNACKNLILNNWISDALWCRTTQEIIARYPNVFGRDATGDGVHDPYSSMDKEISKMGLSHIRRNQHGPSIDKAESRATEILKTS